VFHIADAIDTFIVQVIPPPALQLISYPIFMAEYSGTAGTTKPRKIHPGEALGIIPARESLYMPPSYML